MYEFEKKTEEIQTVRKVETLLDIDAREVLGKIERRYKVRLPRRVIMIDFGEDVGDLYVKFKHAKHTEGEPTDDGRVIIHYDESNEVAAVEILDVATLLT